MIRKLTLLLSLLALYAYSQDSKKFIPGYVVFANGDSLKGLVANLHKNSHEYIDFKPSFSNKDTMLMPKDLKSYKIGDKQYFTIAFPGTEDGQKILHFAEVLVKGNLTLYKSKLKTDPILPPTEAYIVKKVGIDSSFAVGKVKFLLPLIEDEVEVAEIIKTHKYKENEADKIRICQLYNEKRK
ncbi:MAG: hypothetical protein SNJ77_03105 [Cytophagales bacterium]